MADIIQVKDLKKTFGEFEAVKGITFDVKAGEIFAFLGPNGAGKTTTIKMLTTLLDPTAGSIRLDGHDPQIQQNAVRKSFGIVFQDPSLDDELTAYENMDFHGVMYGVPADVRKKRIEELMHFVELWDRRDDLVKTFSGGMKRRLEIARGFLHEPKILFMDEPSIGLDPQTRAHIWTHVQKLNREKNVTVFFTTHHLEEAERNAQMVAIIDHGAIIARGTVEQLKTQTGKGSLEDAFLALTGKTIRAEESSAQDRMRIHSRAWGRK